MCALQRCVCVCPTCGLREERKQSQEVESKTHDHEQHNDQRLNFNCLHILTLQHLRVGGKLL